MVSCIMQRSVDPRDLHHLTHSFPTRRSSVLLFGVRPMPSAALCDTHAMAVPVLDIHEIVAGKLVALIARRTARDLFDAHRIIAMPDLDWSKVKLGTLKIGRAHV